MTPDQPPQPAPRYYSYYGTLTYADFLAHAAAGTLDTAPASTRTVESR